MKDRFRGHVLTFCTTVAEIDQLCERVANYVDKNYFMVCPLHGKLLPEEQKKAFSESENKFKFIFATRIAETAVTIDKVKVVIDIGYDRETVYDQKKKISSFDVMPISVSAAKQRAGRAGRTSAGWCFRLYGKEFERDSMKANKTPEI
jgi:HrpA-like RNA helicase